MALEGNDIIKVPRLPHHQPQPCSPFSLPLQNDFPGEKNWCNDSAYSLSCQPGFTTRMKSVIICRGGLQTTACFSNMLCFSESSSDHLQQKVCFNENLGYFPVVKMQTTGMSVNTDNCCSLALSACHTAACRCCFVQEHAVPLYYENSSQFGRFYRLRIQPSLPAVTGVWYRCSQHGLSLLPCGG